MHPSTVQLRYLYYELVDMVLASVSLRSGSSNAAMAAMCASMACGRDTSDSMESLVYLSTCLVLSSRSPSCNHHDETIRDETSVRRPRSLGNRITRYTRFVQVCCYFGIVRLFNYENILSLRPLCL
jgi:hypothetical protein